MDYRHTQSSAVGIVVVFALLISGGIALAVGGDLELAYGLTLVVGVVVMVGFSRLTTAVVDGNVDVRFTFGWPRRHIALGEVSGVRQVRNRWYHGWGVRKVAGGWMYNVFGMDAVELELVTGRKFRIGTDDPAGLLAAISSSTGLGRS